MMSKMFLGAGMRTAPVAASMLCGRQQRSFFSASSQKMARFEKPKEMQAVEQQQQQVAQRSEYDALTPEARRYLGRVYGVTASGMVTLTAGSCAMLFTPLGLAVPYWAPMVASLVPMIGLSMGYGKTQGRKLGMFHSFTGLTGMGLVPVVAAAKFGGVLAPAVGLTMATYAGFSAAALMAPAGSSVKMQGPLIAGLLGLIGVQLVSLFYPTPLATQLIMYGGLAIFSLLVASDTGAMIERANAGQTDVVMDAINGVLNLVNIFVRMVHMLRSD
eukprot:TRINITY_DN8502_c0_g1_i1.p1 TRINITY_DN8502_c0_g1~~TRINITY_DN8502_c0_g1_i1.p1  ORF type:complete len:292 (+),score=116.13 TRINITY_DN8502_c0_g1_i1:58-876(+)